MNEVLDPVNLFFIAVAVVIFFKLRSVLGTRTGHDRPIDPFGLDNKKTPASERENDDGNVIQMPPPAGADDVPPPGGHDSEDSEALTEQDAALARQFDEFKKLDPSFDAVTFLEGAKAAYEMIVDAFAQGDKKTLGPLLSKQVMSGFANAIDERRKQGQVMETRFVGIDDARITDATLDGKKGRITVRFVSELISVLRDKSGNILEGDDKEIQTIVDIWTFERKLDSKDPNWILVATSEAD